MQERGQVGETLDLKTIVKRNSRRKVWFSEVGKAGLLQKGPFWMTEAEAAAAEGLLLFRTREVVLKAPIRAAPANRQEKVLLGAFPLRNLPEELQLIVAAQVAAPLDRAALCIAVPPLGRKAIKEIKAYQVPLMSLGFRVLSAGAVSAAEVRKFVRKFAPSEATHPPLALYEFYTQLNAMAAPDARVHCVVRGSRLEYRLESGALLRCWKPYDGCLSNYRTANRDALGVHHYEGVAGAERLVRVTFADGEVLELRGERGVAERWAQYYGCPPGVPAGWRERETAGW